MSGPVKVIFIGGTDSPSVTESVFEAGADGFVVKHRAATTMIPAIETALGRSLNSSSNRKP